MIVYHISPLNNIASILNHGLIAGYNGYGLGIPDNKFVFVATSVEFILEFIGIRGKASNYSVYKIEIPENMIVKTGFWDWEKLILDKIPPDYILEVVGLESYAR